MAQLGPDMILAEPPELIATGRSTGSVMRSFVERTLDAVGRVDSTILVMSGAGVSTPDDVAEMIRLGLGGTGSSSAVLRADDPPAALRAMLVAMRRAWHELHPDMSHPKGPHA